jgi:hypothetical protein
LGEIGEAQLRDGAGGDALSRVVAAALSGSRVTRISVDFGVGTAIFLNIVLTASLTWFSWVNVPVVILLVGPLLGALAWAVTAYLLAPAAALARLAQATIPGLPRQRRLIAKAFLPVIIACGAAPVVVDVSTSTHPAGFLPFVLPAAFVAACGLWACALALRRSRRSASRLARRAPDVIAVAATAAALLVLFDRSLLTTQASAVLLFPAAVTASVRLWIRMKDSRRLAVAAGADITLSLLLGAELVLFLAWLANMAGMSRAEVAALRSVLDRVGSDANACLDWRIWVSAYIILAAASAAFAVRPARLKAVRAWFDRLRVADVTASGQRVLTGLYIGLLTITLGGAAAPGALGTLLQRQLQERYVVALQGRFEADGEAAAYAEITREFALPVSYPVLADIVRDVHDESREPAGKRDAAGSEADLAHRLGELQAAALALPSPPALSPAEQAAAGASGLAGPIRDASDLSHRVAETGAQEEKDDQAGKRVELAAELAARAVANTISIPQLGSNEVVQIVMEYLSGLIEDSPLKDVFAAWLEHVPRGGHPPGAATIVVPDPANLEQAAEHQLTAEAAAQGRKLPADPSGTGETDGSAVKDAVDSASQARDVQHNGTCTGCIDLPAVDDEPPVDYHPFEP